MIKFLKGIVFLEFTMICYSFIHLIFKRNIHKQITALLLTLVLPRILQSLYLSLPLFLVKCMSNEPSLYLGPLCFQAVLSNFLPVYLSLPQLSVQRISSEPSLQVGPLCGFSGQYLVVLHSGRSVVFLFDKPIPGINEKSIEKYDLSPGFLRG